MIETENMADANTAQKGSIRVHTDNILPIIKKYLYADQEIFLRELVSNAVDATQKLRVLANRGEVAIDESELFVEIKLDTEARTIIISDHGIGMTASEVQRYIAEVAFSGANEFLEKYKDSNPIIGHFGLGFYSAFMVADKVEIFTKSYQPDAPAAHWTNYGGTEYEMDICDKITRGTDIVLHIGKDGKDYLDTHKIKQLLEKYCRFLPVPIRFGSHTEGEGDAASTVPTVINIPNPAWKKKPADLTDDDYLNFYRTLYPYAEDPLFWIHLNVDHPFNLTGILYFPQLKNTFEVKKDRIHLYCNQVFVTDQVEQIVPDFLLMLHGVIDSPDIPLNVSRSYLQSDPEVKKINQHITRKVADKLAEQFKKDRTLYEERWKDIGVLVKYGVLSNDKFREKAKEDSFCLLENIDGHYFTVSEYREKIAANQTDKNGNTICLYTTPDGHHDTFIEAVKAHNYDVLQFDTMIDPHFIQHLEQQEEKLQFKRVDADTPELLIEKPDANATDISAEQQETIQNLFNQIIDNKMVTVQIKSLPPDAAPVLITRPEFMRRMKEMSKTTGNAGMYDSFGDMYSVVVNGNHPAVVKLMATPDLQAQNQASQYLYDLARLQQNLLKGKELTDFVARSIENLTR